MPRIAALVYAVMRINSAAGLKRTRCSKAQNPSSFVGNICGVPVYSPLAVLKAKLFKYRQSIVALHEHGVIFRRHPPYVGTLRVGAVLQQHAEHLRRRGSSRAAIVGGRRSEGQSGAAFLVRRLHVYPLFQEHLYDIHGSLLGSLHKRRPTLELFLRIFARGQKLLNQRNVTLVDRRPQSRLVLLLPSVGRPPFASARSAVVAIAAEFSAATPEAPIEASRAVSPVRRLLFAPGRPRIRAGRPVILLKIAAEAQCVSHLYEGERGVRRELGFERLFRRFQELRGCGDALAEQLFRKILQILCTAEVQHRIHDTHERYVAEIWLPRHGSMHQIRWTE